MRWARRATLILGAAHAMATALFLTIVITHAARSGTWATTIRFNDFSEGPLELVAAWALLPALAWLIHTALKHEMQSDEDANTPSTSTPGSRTGVAPRSLKTRTSRNGAASQDDPDRLERPPCPEQP